MMATYKRGNMWNMTPSPDLWVVSANSVVKKDGKLVMGAGAALQAREKFPGCDEYFGGRIRAETFSGQFYGFMRHPEYPLGIFQTKYHWKMSSSYDLIRKSLVSMSVLLVEDIINPDYTIAMNFPGIGRGGLDRKFVKRFLDQMLPDNVYVWQFEE